MIIKQYNSPTAVAEAIIDEVFVQAASSAPIHIALSGGSTPRALFELMASPEYRDKICWEHLHLYWVDERCVPPSDEQSNYRMTYEALLRHVPIPEGQVHRIYGEAEAEAEALRYTNLVREQVGGTQGRLPQFDIILLGIGDDGHTSSIFPHQMRLLEVRTPYVVATSPVGQKRICLTGPTILAARRVLFHAVGEGKATILREIATGHPHSLAYPSAYLVREREDIELFTDQNVG